VTYDEFDAWWEALPESRKEELKFLWEKYWKYRDEHSELMVKQIQIVGQIDLLDHQLLELKAETETIEYQRNKIEKKMTE